jgi:hypothetical protein
LSQDKIIEAEGIDIFYGEMKNGKIIVKGFTPEGLKWFEETIKNAIRKGFEKALSR